MALLPLYRRRKRLAEGGGSDVFTYDIPQKVRIQLLMVLTSSVEATTHYTFPENQLYDLLVTELREEIGTYCLIGKAYASSSQDEFMRWFTGEGDGSLLLDAIELWYILVSKAADRSNTNSTLQFKVDRLNARLLEAGIGYELVGKQIVEKSSEFIHQEAVLPALHVLSEAHS